MSRFNFGGPRKVAKETEAEKRIRKRWEFVSLVFVIGILVHGILHDGVRQYFSKVLECSVIVATVFYFYIAKESWGERPKLRDALITIFLVGPLLSLLAATLLYGFVVAINVTLEAIVTHHLVRVPIGEIAVLYAGCLLYVFRSRCRWCYGVTEVLVGLVLAAKKLSSGIPHTEGWDGAMFWYLTASVYLVVRGFDNMEQGLGKDPIVTAFISRLNRSRKDLPVDAPQEEGDPEQS